MLFPIKVLFTDFSIKPNGVLHVGAHEAEELDDYVKFNWGHVIWVEAQPDLAKKLRTRLNPKYHTVIQEVAWSRSGEKLIFNIASNGQSSSLFEFGTHSTSYPEIEFIQSYEVETKRLDEILPSSASFDFVNLDVQGAELEVLRGLGQSLNRVNWVYTELNRKEVYQGCAKVKEIDDFLRAQGFRRVATRWVFGKGWGDGFYVRNSIHISLLKVLIRHLMWITLETPKYFYRVVKTLRQ